MKRSKLSSSNRSYPLIVPASRLTGGLQFSGWPQPLPRHSGSKNTLSGRTEKRRTDRRQPCILPHALNTARQAMGIMNEICAVALLITGTRSIQVNHESRSAAAGQCTINLRTLLTASWLMLVRKTCTVEVVAESDVTCRCSCAIPIPYTPRGASIHLRL